VKSTTAATARTIILMARPYTVGAVAYAGHVSVARSASDPHRRARFGYTCPP
jgi:hypothetical protein